MTGRAARQHLFAADLMIDLQFVALGLRKITVFPLHIVDLALWPDELFRLAVTSEAPFHLERVLLEYCRHVVDRPVAGRATDALCYVNAVIEICIFRQIVNAFPFDRLIIAIAFAYNLKIWTIRPDLAVAVHTCLRRWHSRRCSSLDRLVAIAAIDAVVADVVLMAKLNRLLLLNISPRQIR